MKKIVLRFGLLVIALYLLICFGLFLGQEKLLFHPQKLEKDYTYTFNQAFEEKYITSKDGHKLNGVLFKTLNSKGLIFYLHGNSGSLASWGSIAKYYTDLNYDIFMLDYRGYGKSEGDIDNLQALFDDNQLWYNEFKKQYQEDQIIILGHSLGTGFAAHLQSNNNAKLLILQSPYYSMSDMVRRRFSIVPSFILKYPIQTNEYLKKVNSPIVIFHGTSDRVIPYESSVELKKDFPDKINFITLLGESHTSLINNEFYRNQFSEIVKN